MTTDKLLSGNWFHGDLNKTDFKDRHLDAEDYSRDTNANGPGIYFTRLKWQAGGYAGDKGYVYTATMDLSMSRTLTKKTLPDARKLAKLIELCPEEERQTGFSNYGYDTPDGPAYEIAETYVEANDTMLLAALSILHDFYGRSNNKDWAKAMVAIGYDAYLHKLPEVYHLVVYNPEIIQVKEVRQRMKHLKEFDSFTDKPISESTTSKDTCPVCSGQLVSQCKCMSTGKKTLESLRNGHGMRCANGHVWTYDTPDGNVLVLENNQPKYPCMSCQGGGCPTCQGYGNMDHYFPPSE